MRNSEYLTKKDGLVAQFGKLMNDLYSLPNIVRVVKWRRMRWAGHVARMGEDRGLHWALVGKPDGKRPLGRPRRRWVDNINNSNQLNMFRAMISPKTS